MLDLQEWRKKARRCANVSIPWNMKKFTARWFVSVRSESQMFQFRWENFFFCVCVLCTDNTRLQTKHWNAGNDTWKWNWASIDIHFHMRKNCYTSSWTSITILQFTTKHTIHQNVKLITLVYPWHNTLYMYWVLHVLIKPIPLSHCAKSFSVGGNKLSFEGIMTVLSSFQNIGQCLLICTMQVEFSTPIIQT